jgi:GH15 family glucan-1,4-alpha-glucosidase
MGKPLKTRARVIKRLLGVTRTLIEECSLDNGGIVAANSAHEHYPRNAKNYFYVWPRDASFACVAADELGIDAVQENFFTWCLNRAEGFADSGLFYEKYYPNGLKALSNFQPDQTGSVLFALWHHYRNDLKGASRYHDLVRLAANGICGVWAKDHFTQVTNDLWEERLCFPDLMENFSYSLAACIRGLRCAHAMIPDRKWLRTADEMKRRLDRHFLGYFVRSSGMIPDRGIDASIIGLVYPHEVCDAHDPRMLASIREIEEKLVINGGVHRYEHDQYDGWMFEQRHRNKGAGAWPLLNFWLSIYYSIQGDRAKAEKTYDWVLDRMIGSDHIPEQMFENTIQVSVSPLLWSHTMFALATKQLGFM